MLSYVTRRLIQSLITALVVVTLIFFLIHLLPGDPAMTVLGGLSGQPTAEQIAFVRERLGLDLPLWQQFLRYMGNLATGDFGDSFVTTRPVLHDILLRVPRTLQIIVPALVLAAVIGIPLGIIAATRRGRLTDFLVSAGSVTAFSLPAFVSGLLLVAVFSLNLRWLPSSGYMSPLDDFPGFLARIALPTLTLAVAPAGLVMRMTRSSMLEQLGLDYVTTARAKGLTERAVIYGHALRNSMIPVVTLLGLQAGFMFAGSVIVENIFNWPGVSNLLLESVVDRDYPVIQGVVLIVSLIFILINLATDLIYGLVDPKIRYE